MTDKIFEVKFEIEKDSEEEIVSSLNLEFIKEYKDADNYLTSDGDKTLKFKEVDDGRIIFYEIFFDGECFDIYGRDVGKEEKDIFLKTHTLKITINRKKRVYFLEEFNVKVDLDYIEQLPDMLFLEIHSDNRENVLNASDFIVGKLSLENSRVNISYDRLVKP